MFTGSFGLILEEIGKKLNIPGLIPDANESCCLKLLEGIQIRIEMDKKDNSLLLISDLGELPLGRYRTDILREALKTNNIPPPLHGILSYSQKQNHLILFEKFNLEQTSGEQVFLAIAPFVQKALIWLEAIKHGELPIPTYNQLSTASQGMYGLKR